MGLIRAFNVNQVHVIRRQDSLHVSNVWEGAGLLRGGLPVVKIALWVLMAMRGEQPVLLLVSHVRRERMDGLRVQVLVALVL